MSTRGRAAPSDPPAFAPENAVRDSEWQVAAAGQGDPVVIVVDTLEKTFGLEELLHEVRDRAVTLQLDPDGFLFSYIRTFSDRPDCVLPDRSDMTYSTHCLHSYVRHVLDVAARRKAEVLDAPTVGLDLFLTGDQPVVAEDLLQVPHGRITEAGMRENIRIAIDGVAALLTAPRDEKTPATSRAELARTQLWQWLQHETGVLDSGRIITAELFDEWLGEELAALIEEEREPKAASLQKASRVLGEMTRSADLAPDLAAEAYRLAE